MSQNTHTIGGFEYTVAEFCTKKAAFAIKRAHETGDDEKAADAMMEHLVLEIQNKVDDSPIPKSKHAEHFEKMNINDFQKIMEICSEIFSGSNDPVTADAEGKKK